MQNKKMYSKEDLCTQKLVRKTKRKWKRKKRNAR